MASAQETVIRTMVADTEAEILDSCFPESLDAEPMGDADASLEDVEGWDGDPLDDAELIRRNDEGDPGNGFDRPLQVIDELTGELVNRDHVLANMQHTIANQEMRLNPQWQWQAQQQRDAAINQTILNPEGALQRMTTQEQQIAQLYTDRADLTLARAYERYGDEFGQAYQSLLSLDRNNPLHRQLVQSIYYSQDAGESLMQWWDGVNHDQFQGRASRAARLPSLNSASGGGNRGSYGDRGYEARTSRGEEDEIWQSF
jgi:hypothetical protein